MPRLLLFAACQKAILDRDDLSISLIGVFTGLTVDLPDAEPHDIPANAVAARDWAIGTAWLRMADDGDKTYEQRIEIVAPDGSRVAAGQVAFRMSHRNHNMLLRNQGIPMGQVGEYQVELSLREAGTAEEWQLIAQYPIEVRHARPQPAPEGEGQPAAK